MILDVRFRWAAEIVRHGRRKVEKVHISDLAPVEVRDVTALEAPIAFRYDGGELGWEGRIVELRSFADRLWRPVLDPTQGSDGPAPLHTVQSLQAAVSADKSVLYTPFKLDRTFERAESRRDLGDCRFQSDPDAARQQKVSELQRVAADLLIIDGIVHQPAAEPVYRIRTSGYHREYGDLEVVSASHVGPETPPTLVFRADMRKEAVARMVRMELEVGKSEGDRVEVLIPELVTFRYDMRPRLEEGARHIRDAMVSELKSADLPFAAAYIRLRDAIAAQDHQLMAAVLIDDVIPVLEKSSAGMGYTPWELSSAVELKDEWMAFGDQPELAPEDLAALAC